MVATATAKVWVSCGGVHVLKVLQQAPRPWHPHLLRLIRQHGLSEIQIKKMEFSGNDQLNSFFAQDLVFN